MVIKPVRKDALWQVTLSHIASNPKLAYLINSPMSVFTSILANRQLIEFVKYVAASATALALDYLIYLAAVQYFSTGLPSAAALGYLGGLVLAYFVIGKGVFKNGWLKNKKTIEALLFLCSGLLGIAITYVTVTVFVSLFGPRLNEAKITAIICSFFSVYLFRKFCVFRKST